MSDVTEIDTGTMGLDENVKEKKPQVCWSWVANENESFFFRRFTFIVSCRVDKSR